MSNPDPLRSAAPAPLRWVRLGAPNVVVERRSDGCHPDALAAAAAPYPAKLTERLDYWAKAAPDRIFLAQRNGAGAWRTLTYAAAFAKVRAIAAALLARDLSPDRPIAILSGNDIEHALIGLAAMHVGIPYAPISVPYSLLSQDFGKLKAIIDILTPGLVFAANGTAFARAIAAAVPPGVEVVVTANPPPDRPATSFAELSSAQPTPAVEAAHAEVGPDTIAKVLFTSGSTGQPKGVINTQRMLCANQVMIRAGFSFFADEPPVVVDWLPWNHTFGSNHNFGLVLDNGGSLYIDEGKPMPGAIEATVRNLRDIAPTIYFNVPKGFEMLLPYLDGGSGAARKIFQPAQSPVLCRRGAVAARSQRAGAARHRHNGRAHHFSVEPRLDGNGAAGGRLQLGKQARRQYRPARAGRGTETRAARGQARGAAQGSQHHAGLLARAGADRGRVRRGGVLQDRRCAQV